MERTNLAPWACEPFALACFFRGAVLTVFELLFGIAVIIRHLLHGVVAESTAEHFARLNARPALRRTLQELSAVMRRYKKIK